MFPDAFPRKIIKKVVSSKSYDIPLSHILIWWDFMSFVIVVLVFSLIAIYFSRLVTGTSADTYAPNHLKMNDME